jgi:hypothetical protein
MVVENNGTQETRGFIQVRASVGIKTLCPVCVSCIMISLVETPSTHPFYRLRVVGFTWKIWLVMFLPDPDSISTCAIYKIRSIIIF